MEELMVLLEFTARYQGRLIVTKKASRSFFRVVKVGFTSRMSEGTVLQAFVRPVAPDNRTAREAETLEQPFDCRGRKYRVECHPVGRFDGAVRPAPTPLPVAVDYRRKYDN